MLSAAGENGFGSKEESKAIKRPLTIKPVQIMRDSAAANFALELMAESSFSGCA